MEADSLVGFAWALGNNASFARMSSRLRTDLLARLTTMPFWLNHGGKFERGDRVLDHWSEARQIAWLTGGYVVGDAFTKDANRSDIVFSSIDHTGLILKLESKQRIWRWLDHRQGCGLTGLDSAAVTALITLAALVDGSRMATLASMVLWLAFYEIKSSTWKVPKVDHAFGLHRKKRYFLGQSPFAQGSVGFGGRLQGSNLASDRSL